MNELKRLADYNNLPLKQTPLKRHVRKENKKPFIIPNRYSIAKYDDSKMCEKASKINANQLFLNALDKYSNNTRGNILYLDAKSMLTTKTLKSLQQKSILMPVNFDPLVMWFMRPSKNKIRPFLGTLRQSFEYHYQRNEKLRGVWADYCGTFDGNKLCDPKDDLQYLFRSKLMARQSIFAVTFCLRDRRINLSVARQKYRIHNWISQMGKQNGYRLTKLYSESYFPLMFLSIYLVH